MVNILPNTSLPTCDLCGGTEFKPFERVYDVVLRSNPHPYHLRQCLGCGWLVTDATETASGADYYTSDYYSFQPFSQEQISAWKKHITPAEKPERVLDVGCGSGEWLFREKLRGHEVWGLEEDARAVKAARASGLDVVRDFKELPEGYFDYAHLSHVLEHVRSPSEMLRNVKSKLKPGGRVEILVPNAQSAKFDKLLQVSNITDVPRHVSFFSEATLRRLLQKTGFQPGVITQVNVPWRINLRETVGDLRRLTVYASKSKAPLPRLVSLLGNVLLVHLNPMARTGVRKDWLFARATRE